MAYFADYIRTHAFKTIHDFEDFDAFEAEMIAFGQSLSPLDSPTAHDPHYRELCKGAAAWAWEGKNTIAAYDQSLTGAHQRTTSSRDHVLKLRS